jgi:hypothetical protein
MGIHIQKLMGQVISDPASFDGKEKNVSEFLLGFIHALISEIKPSGEAQEEK